MFNTITELVEAINSQTTYKVVKSSHFKNGRMRDAIEVKGEDSWVNPIIYDPEFMLEYDINQVVDFINKCYKDHGVNREEIVKVMDNKESFLKIVHSEIVNGKLWDEQIKTRNLVSHEFFDLRNLYHLELEKGMCIKVSIDMIERLGITLQELDDSAWYNDWNDCVKKKMSDYMPFLEEMPEDDMMHIISSKDGYYGARYINDAVVLDNLCGQYGYEEVVILPSSRHEIIVIEHKDDMDVDEMFNMVKFVNDTELSEDDYLSDNVYIYNTHTGLWKIPE